ncbi:MAG: PKD domain-containing protein, partial [Bacteroidia bacterium]
MKTATQYLALTALLFMYIVSANAQGEANIWYFGNNAGLNFNTNPPTPLTNGALVTGEGCASIADKNGALLFYTDGSTVWNKNHVAMPNGTGLFGNSSSTQSAIIVPYPGTYNYYKKRFDKYYIVTVDYLDGNNGISYSEVDMTLNGGLGAITSLKNIALFDQGAFNTTEKICVAQHSNECDFWVIGKPLNSPNFNAYAVTSLGFNTTPVISNVGPITGRDIGAVKASPNSKLIAAAYGLTKDLYLYDFNNTTGMLTNKFSDANATTGQSYGVEFSPNNKLLYFTGGQTRNIHQYDLTVANNAAFLASKLSIGSTSTPGCGTYTTTALQLASNGKIYVALCNDNKLGVINMPNTLGVGAGYSDRTVDLGGKISQLGLPALVTSLIRPVNTITPQGGCVNELVQLGLTDTSKIDTYNWRIATLANPLAVLASSTVFNPTHTFTTIGDYLVVAINTYACYTDTIIDTLHIGNTLNLGFTSVPPLCNGGANGTITANITGGIAPYTYLWSTMDSTATITGLAAATYGVQVTDINGCAIIDTIPLTQPAPSLANFTLNGADTAKICIGATVNFDASTSTGSAPITYAWTFHDATTATGITATNAYSAPGVFYVQLSITDGNNCVTTPMRKQVQIADIPSFTGTHANRTTICEGDTTMLTGV